MSKAFVPTARSRVKRMPKRGHYDRATVYAILDAGFTCHVGYGIDGQPCPRADHDNHRITTM